MPNYKKLYFKLFNKVSDTVDDLQEVQCQVEEEIISDQENQPEQADNADTDKKLADKLQDDKNSPNMPNPGDFEVNIEYTQRMD